MDKGKACQSNLVESKRLNRIGIVGRNGQLARALSLECQQEHIEFASSSREECDMSGSPESIGGYLKSLGELDGIINASAYTAVDKAEEEAELAHKVNSDGVEALAKHCSRHSLPLIHVSTDYVFAGSSDKPYAPDDETNPINVYGKTKLAGENVILSSGANAGILRTSWVFDGVGNNFLTTMLRLRESRDELNVVADQIGRPTFARHLAQACLIALLKLRLSPKKQCEIYHVSGTGNPISWAEFAKTIFEKTDHLFERKMKVNEIPASEYPTPASRPAYSVMDNTKFEKVFNFKMPDWENGLNNALEEWAQKKGI